MESKIVSQKESLQRRVASTVERVPDFPRTGINFVDITPVLSCGELFADVVQWMCEVAVELGAEAIVAPEARGFVFGAPVAAALKLPLILGRKTGKLPRTSITETMSMEYAEDVTLCMHEDSVRRSVKEGQTTPLRVVIVDDAVATGASADALQRLITKAGGEVCGMVFMVEISGLDEVRSKTIDAKLLNYESLVTL